MSSPQTATHNPAKAVQYVCHLLRSYGVGPKQLSPELVRQAKLLDAPLVRAQDWMGRHHPTGHQTHTCSNTCCYCRPASPC